MNCRIFAINILLKEYIYIYIFLSSDTVYLHFAHLVIFFHIAEQTTFSLKFHKFRSPPVNVSILRFAFASSKSKFHGTYWLRSRVSPLFEHILRLDPWKYSRGIDRERESFSLLEERRVIGKGGVKGGKERRAVFRWPVAGTPHAGNMQIARLKRAHTMTEAPGRRGMVARRGAGKGSNVRNCTRRL